MVDVLLRAGAELRQYDDGRTAFHAACAAGHEEVARALIAAAEPSSLELRTARAGQTALDLAKANDFGPIARRLAAEISGVVSR